MDLNGLKSLHYDYKVIAFTVMSFEIEEKQVYFIEKQKNSNLNTL